ncbi:proton-conducting transporter transmembrane domain-containing protein [Natronospira bacteriovora]|uniref:Proton-conducting transporter membrane subunit n=1 Tax=Natronospira bacteriovora TaxID=3069753 RepID=A0ABU0WA97_9GAMM|nr:proton-conducting transporter membrane subunit [Natronospira sp. AB-CW4]MDQ2070693.1 proton-conducting transporter membrane subunit [Natronospira sp. AB-CW4]
MDVYAAMPLWVVLSSLLAAVIILVLGEPWYRSRIVINLLAAGVKIVLVSIMLWGVARGDVFSFHLTLLPGVELQLHADALTMLLSTLSAILWLVTTIYAIAYLKGSPNHARFFGFFSLCVAATMGVATAGNLFTFFLFYELLTLATWPLVVHRGTRDALRSGALYLLFTLGGGGLLLLGIIAVQSLAGTTVFQPGGFLHTLDTPPAILTGVFILLFSGFAVKAAIVPLHIWLPRAMVAPAPVSALLHAVAVVKAGAFGIVRLVYDVYGLDLTALLGLNHLIAGLAAFTILYGSIQALRQQDLKRRLAYSTVSQVSYIVLGVGIGGPLATIGGLVHLVHQGLMKITLFFCAGNVAETHGVKTVADMNGIGRRMPWTMLAFTVAALGMIGIPPIAGFLSKWYLGLGGIAAGQYWVIPVLVASTLLNAAYFLPVLKRAWFDEPDPAQRGTGIAEASPGLLWPALFTAALALGSGILAGMPLSPLQWTTLIVDRFYG